jgi:hypothetical protein
MPPVTTIDYVVGPARDERKGAHQRVFGAWGGLRCGAVCGGFVAATGAREGGAAIPIPLVAVATVLARKVAYQGSRLAVARALCCRQRVPRSFGTRPPHRSMPIPALQHAGARPFGAALPAIEFMRRRPGTTGRVMLGPPCCPRRVGWSTGCRLHCSRVSPCKARQSCWRLASARCQTCAHWARLRAEATDGSMPRRCAA